jgi:probable phosphoglycerate mutase
LNKGEAVAAAAAQPPIRLAHRLVFVRHGETDWNVEGRLQGQQDIPLNPRGRDQAAAVGRALRRAFGAEALAAHAFVASPMQRTRDTMEIARAAMTLPARDYALDDRLKELTFGAWEGLTWREVTERDPEGAERRERDKWGFTPPGGESYADLCRRVAPWLGALDRETLVVSHGGVARAMLHLVAGMEAVEAAMAPIAQGRAILVEAGRARWI